MGNTVFQLKHVNTGQLLWQTPTEKSIIYDESFFLKMSELIGSENSLFFSITTAVHAAVDLGAILTGFGLGIVEGLTKVFFPEASNTVIFVIMAIVLLVRPAGLFGRRA